jgi:hypothetical protein
MEQTLSLEEKIKNEKRRRNQIYITLDYLLSILTYFDFFSNDAFKITKYSKYLADIYNQDLVTSELLLLPFFHSSNQVSSLLEEFKINENLLKNLIFVSESKNQKSLNLLGQFKKIKNWKVFFFDSKKRAKDFSHEVNLIFEKAAENALIRFKTPIITSDILFLTLMEQKNCKASKIIQKILKNETNWYLLRYKLIKHIHYHESNIRSEVSKNQQYFAYLLKTQLSENEFDRLIKNEGLSTGVSLFRNTLISNVLKKNFFELLLKEIQQSINITNFRKYSS